MTNIKRIFPLDTSSALLRGSSLKYEIALALAGKDQIERGVYPYQDVNSLVALRNALIHYEPESQPCGDPNQPLSKDSHKIEKLLKNKFTINPFTGEGNPFYPDKCLSHGCCEWAINSSIAFTDKFFQLMELKPIYDDARKLFHTK